MAMFAKNIVAEMQIIRRNCCNNAKYLRSHCRIALCGAEERSVSVTSRGLQTKALQLAVKSTRVDSKLPGRARTVEAVFFQRSDQKHAFEFIVVGGDFHRWNYIVLFLQVIGEMLGANRPALAKDAGVLDDIGEFAHIARVGVIKEYTEGGRCNAVDVFWRMLPIFGDKVIHQQRNVIVTFP